MGQLKTKFNRAFVLYLVMTGLLVGALFYNRILPDLFSHLIKVVLILLAGVFFLRPLRQRLLIVLSILMFISSGTLFYSQYTINRLIDGENIETEVVTFVVLKDSPIETLSDLQDKIIGVAGQMELSLLDAVKETLSQEGATYSLSEASDDLSNMERLYAKTIDLMILDNSLRDTLIEADPQFETKTKIIYTLKKDTIKDDTSIDVDTSQNSFIVLISGVDTRTSGSVADTARSDVNILMMINPKTHAIMTVSIPRDTYTPLGCRGGKMDKLTHSGIFGIDCTVKTVENLFGLKINYYVKVNFTAFLKIVKVLGSIEVYSKYAFTTSKYTSYTKSYTYKVGMNVMNAEQALFFARERHAFETGDVQRGLNQQEVIKGIVKKVVEPSTLLKIEELVTVASKSVVTNMPIESVMKLIQAQVADNQPWSITTSALTGTIDYQPTYSLGRNRLLYVSWPDLVLLETLKRQISYFMNARPE